MISTDSTALDRVESGRLVAIPGGWFEQGEPHLATYEGDGDHLRPAQVRPFLLAATAVTNRDFAAFVDATGHRTTAERCGWSFVFAALLPDDFPPTRGVVGAEWWRLVDGARWNHPEGPQSTLRDRWDHPVVHVSHHDARAYCQWTGTRLPTEVEWERAAKAGTTTTWPWGDDREPAGQHRMNVFQGRFPAADTGADGWIGTCPVDAYEPNPYGLWNLVGNVWEWTSSPFTVGRPGHCCGPDTSTSSARLTTKGGSYLCHESYCNRFRPSGRMGTTPDTTTGNIGFRCAADQVPTVGGSYPTTGPTDRTNDMRGQP